MKTNPFTSSNSSSLGQIAWGLLAICLVIVAFTALVAVVVATRRTHDHPAVSWEFTHQPEMNR